MKLVPLAGIEPTLIAYETNILPLNYRGYLKLAAPPRLELGLKDSKSSVLTITLRSHWKLVPVEGFEPPTL